MSSQIIWNSFAQETVSSSSSMYLLHNLFISTWTHRYLIYTLDYNLILLYIGAKFFHLWPLGALSVGCHGPLTYAITVNFFPQALHPQLIL